MIVFPGMISDEIQSKTMKKRDRHSFLVCAIGSGILIIVSGMSNLLTPVKMLLLSHVRFCRRGFLYFFGTFQAEKNPGTQQKGRRCLNVLKSRRTLPR